MRCRTVKGVFLLVSLMMFAGSVSALEANDYARRTLKSNEIILKRGVTSSSRGFIQVTGHIDADVLDWGYASEAFEGAS